MNIQFPVAIIGMGITGNAVERLLNLIKSPLDTVFLFDNKLQPKNDREFNDPEKLLAQKPRTLIVSPGVPLNTSWIHDFCSQGLVTSEMEICFQYLENEITIGVTGSVGKSTTCTLLQKALESFDPTAFVGGNLGVSFATYIADVLTQKRPRAKHLVLELSSYQLEQFKNARFAYSVFTYFSANHLERYESLVDYYKTKWTLAQKTEKKVFINAASSDLIQHAQHHPLKIPFEICTVESIKNQPSQLLGLHNRQNLALCFALAKELGWPSQSIQAFNTFKGLAHRIENLGVKRGVQFVNDSKATTLESIQTAVEAVMNKNTLHLLLGGRDKNLPWQSIKNFFQGKNIHIYYFGEARSIIHRSIEIFGDEFTTLNEAIDFCFSKAKSGDVVLLSPGGTSLDEFKNFEERGDFFRKKVEALL